jgi:hypothetical protein
VIVPQGDVAEFEVSHISVVCIKSLRGRRGKYLLFMSQKKARDQVIFVDVDGNDILKRRC